MTPERQREVIAEWCGWKQGQCGWWTGPNGEQTPHLPDYLNDLNAMHEAVGKLPCTNPETHMSYWSKYVDQIQRVTRSDSLRGAQAVLWCIESTASQRAEALLRTIGKWED